MKKVKFKKAYSTAKKGETLILNDFLASDLVRSGTCEYVKEKQEKKDIEDVDG